MPRQRYRNLEMIMSGRNKFELRDLETLSDDSITSLVLPKLPSDINSASVVPLSGLIRTTATTTTSDRLPSTNTGTTITRRISDGIDEIDSNLISNNKHNNNGLCPLARKESITSSEMESFEEEKLIIDNNSSEKSMKVNISCAYISNYQFIDLSSSNRALLQKMYQRRAKPHRQVVLDRLGVMLVKQWLSKITAATV